MTEAKKPDSSGFKSVFEENKHQGSGHRMQFSVPRKSEREAVELAYQWEALAKRAAKQGAEYPQPLGLEPLIELASKNALELGRWLDEAQISRPDLPEIG